MTVLEADELHRASAGAPLFSDERATALAGKLATVDQNAVVHRYIPFADGRAETLRLDPTSTQMDAVRGAYGIHLA